MLQTTILDFLEIKEVTLGDVIIQQGQKGDAVFIVNKGNYEVRIGKTDEEISKAEGTVVHQYRGDFDLYQSFGELAVMEDEDKRIRKASVVCTSNEGEVWIIPGELYSLLADQEK